MATGAYRRRGPRREWLFVSALSTEEKEELLGEWIIREDKFGCWRAYTTRRPEDAAQGGLTAAQGKMPSIIAVSAQAGRCQHHDVVSAASRRR